MSLLDTFTRAPARWLTGAGTGRYRHAAATSGAAAADRAQRWRPVWRAAADGAGLARVVASASGPTTVTPTLTAVRHVPGGTVLRIRPLPGQLVEDYTAAAPRLAAALRATHVRVSTACQGAIIVLGLLDADPLAEPFRIPLIPVPSASAPLILGRDEDGTTVLHALIEAAHILCQGQNGSGKSRWTYGLLGQVAHADDVVIAGSDITGLLLGRPFDGTRHRDWQAAGSADLEEHAAALECLVAEMDTRLADMPRGVDKLDPSVDRPLMLVVLEEFPGLLRAAAAVPKPGRGEGRPVVDRIRSAVLRLLSEGRKVAFRVLMLAQRAEAEATGGGYAREQFALVVSFRVPADSLVMGHGDDARDLGAAHRTAPPGIAVVSTPGRPLTRMRAPWVGAYAEYVATVGAFS